MHAARTLIGIALAIILGGCQTPTSGGSGTSTQAKGDNWVKLGDFGGVSGETSDEFVIDSDTQRIEWTVTTKSLSPISITFTRLYGEFGERRENVVVVPEADAGQLSGTTRTLLLRGRYRMLVTSAGSWSVRMYQNRP